MPPQFASGATYSAPSTAAGILGPSPADSKVVCQLCNKAGHTAPACLALLALAEPSSGVMVNVREAWAKAFIPYSCIAQFEFQINGVERECPNRFDPGEAPNLIAALPSGFWD